MYKLETLTNGLQLITAPRTDTQAVTVLVLVKVGSRYETEKLNGVSHFIEHLLFKGTAKRPTSLHISRELDGVGAEYNAFTAKDHTGYYIKVNKERLELALDILSDILFKPLFPAVEIERERGVIIEEINMYEDNPLMLIGDIFEGTIFANHPLGKRISGPKANIKAISRHEIIKFYREYYFNKKLILGLSGNYNQAEAKKLINKYFSGQKISAPVGTFSGFSFKQSAPQLTLHYKETAQVQLALGFPAYKNTDHRVYPLMLLAVILGGGMSSRLFMEIREKLGLAYFVRAGVDLYEDTGSLIIQAGLEQTNITTAIKKILAELKKIKERGITPAELVKAREFIKGKLILQLEDSAALISWLAEQRLLTGKIDDLPEKLKKINRVSLAEVESVAAEIINFKRLNLALIGPFKNKAEFLKIISTKGRSASG
ncbi:MAG: pitrilysin family protein [Candidatus Komeilibacteria bacterium]|nr:pitrilysin family protein [Candidatus Komeilibacteria bacterium]